MLLLFLLLSAPASHAAGSGMQDSARKARFAINFAKFTEWPPDRLPPVGGAFTLCQMGGSASLRRTLIQAEGRTIQGFPIAFRQIAHIDESTGCMVLFVHAASALPPPQAPVLTVGDGPGFAARGGMISFLNSGHGLAFEVNAVAMQRAGLTLSSQVLSLAASVIEPNRMAPGQANLSFRPVGAASASMRGDALQPAADPGVVGEPLDSER